MNYWRIFEVVRVKNLGQAFLPGFLSLLFSVFSFLFKAGFNCLSCSLYLALIFSNCILLFYTCSKATISTQLPFLLLSVSCALFLLYLISNLSSTFIPSLFSLGTLFLF